MQKVESKLTALGIIGFLALAGLSVDSVRGLPVDNNATTSASSSVMAQPRSKMSDPDLVFKVEVVYHEGKVKKFMSYLRSASLESNGTPPTTLIQVVPKRLDREVPHLPKYTEFFHRIPPPSLPTPILAAADTTCQTQKDFRVATANFTDFLGPPMTEDKSFTGLLVQCDPNEYPVLVEQRYIQFWYLESCSSGNPLLAFSRSLHGGASVAVSVADAAISLYTIFLAIGTTNQTMIFNPLVNFNVSSFLQNFPFDLMEIKHVFIRGGALYNSWEKENLKKVMGGRKYVIQEEESLSSYCFMVFHYVNEPEPPFCSSDTFLCRYGLYIFFGFFGFIGLMIIMIDCWMDRKERIKARESLKSSNSSH